MSKFISILVSGFFLHLGTGFSDGYLHLLRKVAFAAGVCVLRGTEGGVLVADFDCGFHGTFLTAEYIRSALADVDSVTVEESNEREVLVWDDEDCKEIRFRFLERLGPAELVDIISVSADIPERYQVDKRILAEYLWSACDRNAFITLEQLVIIWSEPDDTEAFEPADFEDTELARLCETYGDEYAYEIGKGYLGQLWFERNIAVVNMGEIVRTAQEIARENRDVSDAYFSEECQVEIGFLTTVLHELRHLELDTNILLPEDDYPLEWASEANVEAYCQDAFEAVCIPDGLFPQLYQKSFDAVLGEATARQSGERSVDAGVDRDIAFFV